MSDMVCSENESIVRQMGSGGDPIYYDPNRKPDIVHSTLFLPTSKDVDGLSLLNPTNRSLVWCAFRVEQPETRFRLVCLNISNLAITASVIGFHSFDIVDSEDCLDLEYGLPYAHCVAQQINRVDYEKDKNVKKMIKEWALSVARSISVESILGPFPKPCETDSYRPDLGSNDCVESDASQDS